MSGAQDAAAVRHLLKDLFNPQDQSAVRVEHRNATAQAVVATMVCGGTSRHPDLFCPHTDGETDCGRVQPSDCFIQHQSAIDTNFGNDLGNEKSPLHSGVLVGLDEDSAHAHAGGRLRAPARCH